MSGVRIYDLANDLGVPSKTLVDYLGKMGYPVKSHSSTIDNNLADRLRRQAQAQKVIGTKPRKTKKAVEEPVAAPHKEAAAPKAKRSAKPTHVMEPETPEPEATPSQPVEAQSVKTEEAPAPPTQAPAPILATEPAPASTPPAVEVVEPKRAEEIKAPPRPADHRPSAQGAQAARPSGQTPAARPSSPYSTPQRPAPARTPSHPPAHAPRPQDRRPAATPQRDFQQRPPRPDYRPKDQAGKPISAPPPPSKKLPDTADKPQKRREDGRGDKWEHKKRGDDERRKLEKIRRKEEEDAKRKAMVETRRKRHELDEGRRKEMAEEAEISRMIAEEDRVKKEAAARKIIIDEATTVREFAEKLRVGANEIIRRLIAKGIMATVNQTLDSEVARELATDMGFEIITRGEDEVKKTVKEVEDTSGFTPRSPVVTIMGHVDHGKTSLLDTIRKTSVTTTEAGGITQRIGAYSVKLDKGMVVFLDTPGHEAFTAMRARGAAATDIVVLVVAADDGVMPQTVEAIHHAKAAGVPVLVAINKIDKPGANPQRVKEELMAHELVSEEWGGKTIFCEVSAKKNLGIDHLLDMIILQAEVLELKADPNRLAYGVIIESKLDKGKGPIATALVQKGTLKVGDPLVAGVHYGKVRALIDDKGHKMDSAGPSVPVEVWGFSGVPMAGETFMVTETERRAHQIAVSRLNTEKIESARSKKGHMKLENLHAQISKGDVKELNIIIKADVQGSIEAVKKSMEDLKVEDVRIRVLHGAVGGITETDVSLAAASNAIIIGFNVRPSDKARALAEAEEVDVRLYSVIYTAIDDVKKALEGMLEPVFAERVTGRAEVRQVFNVTKVGFIAGCLVISGKITRGSDVRLIRDSVVVYTGKVTSLRRIKDDAREVVAGYECGIGIGYSDIKPGDALETFVSEKVERKGD